MSDGTFGSLTRDYYPEMATIYIPVFGEDAPRFMMMAFKYSDGRVSRRMFTNPEWMAMTEEQRIALTVPDEWLEESEGR